MKNFLIALSILIWSCTQDIDFELDYEGEKLVLHGKLDDQDTLIVYLSHTTPPLADGSSSNQFVNNASINLFVNGTYSQQLLPVESGRYRSDGPVDLNTGTIYLEVGHQNYGAISTSVVTGVQAPHPVFSEFTRVVDEVSEEVQVIIKVGLENAQGDYFEIRHDFIYTDTLRGYVTHTSKLRGLGNDELVPGSCRSYSNSNRNNGFSSGCIKDLREGVYFEINYSGEVYKTKLSVSAISEDLYLYNDELHDAEVRRMGNGYFEPRQIHSNISGGYGIFGVRNTVEYELNLETGAVSRIP